MGINILNFWFIIIIICWGYYYHNHYHGTMTKPSKDSKLHIISLKVHKEFLENLWYLFTVNWPNHLPKSHGRYLAMVHDGIPNLTITMLKNGGSLLNNKRMKVWDYTINPAKRAILSPNSSILCPCLYGENQACSTAHITQQNVCCMLTMALLLIFFPPKNIVLVCPPRHLMYITLNFFWGFNKELTGIGFEPMASGLTCRRSTNWAI